MLDGCGICENLSGWCSYGALDGRWTGNVHRGLANEFVWDDMPDL